VGWWVVRAGPTNHIFYVSLDPAREPKGYIFFRGGEEYSGTVQHIECGICCAKTAEPIKLSFGVVSPRNCILVGGPVHI